MRLRSGIADDGLPLREDCRHDRVFGGGHTGFIEQDVCSTQAFGSELKNAVIVHFCAEGFQCQNMSIQPAATDHVPAGGRQTKLTATSCYGTGKQDGCTDAPTEFHIQRGRFQLSGGNFPRGRAEVFHIRPHA